MIDVRPALVLATVKDEEKRRRLTLLASAIEAPPNAVEGKAWLLALGTIGIILLLVV